MNADNQSITGETGRKYFTQMLNMAEDDLDPFQYRLLAHYVRWAGYSGIVQETIKETAHKTRMSEKKVRASRAELIELGYLQTYEPTLEERGEGIPGIVEVRDRWLENVMRYAEKAPQVNMPEVVIEAEVNMPEPPQVNMPHIEELKSIEDKDVAGELKKPRKVERSDNFKRLALESFGIADVDALDKTSAIRITQLESWLKNNSPGATPETLSAFYDWYDKQMRGAARPKDPAKFGEHFTAFKQHHLIARQLPPEVIDRPNIVPVEWGTDFFVRKPVSAVQHD